MEDIVNVTEARKQIFNLVKKEDWDNMQETLFLESIPEMAESMIKGMNTPVDQCFE